MVTFALLIIIIGVALLLLSLKATYAMITIAALVIVMGFVLLLYSLYATVVKNKNAVLEALSGIDVQLRKRYDLIPNLLTIAKKFMEHENELFGKITELRSKAINSEIGTREKFKAEAELDAQLKALMVNVENYPALKSDATMVQAMQTYNEVEEHISAARRFYNSALTQLRNSIQIFPGSIFAACAGNTANLSYFETDEVSRKPINAKDFM